METTTMDRAAAQNFIEINRALFEASSGRFEATLAAVPLDRFTWTPTETGKTILRIVAHVAAAHEMFVEAFAGKDLGGFEAIIPRLTAAELAITSREEAETRYHSSKAALLEAYGKLDPEVVGLNEGIRFFVSLPSRHLETHAGQIDYVQMCYGDHEFHF
jgi:hypothetical protein